MNCIFCCVFNHEKYVDMFFLLLESIYIYGNLDEDTHILVYTSTAFMNKIKQSHLWNETIQFEINDTYDNIDKACKARLDLFHLPSVNKYNKILYLDTDILVKDTINKVFDVCIEDLLYVLEEGVFDCNSDYWGKTLFGNEQYADKSAFTSGILLFNHCEKIKDLFNKIIEDMIKRPYYFSCFDQPYIIYNAFKYNLFNNKILKALVVNNDYNIYSNKVIHHFPGGPGVYEHKIVKMNAFLNKIKKNNIMNDVFTPPTKNITIPLVGLCVSYNYMDTLNLMLPVNYLHFEKIYLITQLDDNETIQFCKKFHNVTILFYTFKHDNLKFDKYGALNYAQKIAYTDFPESWYLIIDSDIILPNNLISILNQENLNPNCIYGATRNNVLKSSELLNKTQIINNPKNLNWVYNNILHLKNNPPSILGCFQLYKKHVYHRDNVVNAGYGDFFFGHDNFDLFCNLGSIIYLHLGQFGINWNGKLDAFTDDINISLPNIYYNFNKKINTVYYDKTCQVVQYGNSKNIEDDLWTCSAKMRYDIYDFFKNKHEFKLAEIGSHKGYSTKVLSNMFSKVYAIDNSIEWTAFNKNFNKTATNIEYVMLDIYKDSWEILPNDIEVSFIDAGHSYECCKSDILNSIQHFKKLQYIILDDYGVWSGVKQIVDELIINNVFKFEAFIGLTNVPGPNGIVTNVHEGIICSINNIIQLINKKYTWGNSFITFLDNFKMDAFGEGTYSIIDKQTIQANFGYRIHIIVFTNDYKEFVSIRKGDLQTLHGKEI